jgi:integrase/recombinase XerD
MVQLKILLDTRRVKSDGTYPIVIRITNIKEVRYIQYGISVPEDKWDATNRCVRVLTPY